METGPVVLVGLPPLAPFHRPAPQSEKHAFLQLHQRPTPAPGWSGLRRRARHDPRRWRWPLTRPEHGTSRSKTRCTENPPEFRCQNPLNSAAFPCSWRVYRNQSFFPFPRQEGTRRRCGTIVKRSRRPGEAGKATRRAVLRGPREEQGGCPPGYGMRGTPPRPPTSSHAARDAPASRCAALLAGNLARPSYSVRISGTRH